VINLTDEEEQGTCFLCDEPQPVDDLTMVDGELLCNSCVEEHCVTCFECSEVILIDDATRHEGDSYCESCFNDLFTQCDGCNDTFHNSYVTYHDNDDCVYCEDCYPSENDEDNSHSDIGCTQNSKTFWGACYDGSLDDCLEVMSPKMNGDVAFKSIQTMCETLSDCGFEATSRAGIHVHFDFTGHGEADIKKIVAAYYLYEELIERMLPVSRRTNSYCKRLKSNYPFIADNIVNKLDGIYCGRTGEKTSRYNSLRYANLNIHSWYYRGTLEVRSHSATLNPTKIQNWILIHHKFFEYALSKTLKYWILRKPSLKEFKGIIGQTLYNYYNQRVAQFAGTKKANNGRITSQLRKKGTILSNTTTVDDRATRQLLSVFD